ncbi:hypothetical protein LOY55_12850 [Pseudomonas sp. B21-040]|jgi:hypothetical protein|uniref:hypothetical protein n=1 Tax=unclassified Pseudomonas TaxID=196821 RepID=UPI000D6AFF2E|nr:MULTISPECIES: hypothetical protein [unclassified Pseudomonas]PWK45550.1 hypothetical protein C7534_101136 [Pseudomonas sp. OV226]UVL42931.1 hypothetical protein LOY55_12850 [Pseudomonas sp. B21-040]
MKNPLTFLLFPVAIAALANTTPGIPPFDADCPANVTVHADQDGPVLINNKEAETKAVDDRHFETTGSGVTISISLAEDDSVVVSATSKSGKVMCQSVED